MNIVPRKRSKKESREYKALLGLIELYLKIGKPIGSSTLQENGFESLSTATLRNYFAELEKEGYLKQPHLSGGRVPTAQAFRFYAEEMQHHPVLPEEVKEALRPLEKEDTKNITTFLQQAAELLSDLSGQAVFLSSARFDNDFILDIKFVSIDSSRLLCVIVTNFGQILTELLTIEQKLSTFSLKRIEQYFNWKLKNQEKPELTLEEEQLAQTCYNEIMVRYLVRYTNFSEEEIHRTGFSRLLAHPEFHDPISLTTGLALFENTKEMRTLLHLTAKGNGLRFWIGEEIALNCSILAIPYYINNVQAGAIGILGPCRMPYRELFGTLSLFSKTLSETLTKTLYKFKLTFRHARSDVTYAIDHKWKWDEKTQGLLEVKQEKK